MDSIIEKTPAQIKREQDIDAVFKSAMTAINTDRSSGSTSFQILQKLQSLITNVDLTAAQRNLLQRQIDSIIQYAALTRNRGGVNRDQEDVDPIATAPTKKAIEDEALEFKLDVFEDARKELFTSIKKHLENKCFKEKDLTNVIIAGILRIILKIFLIE